MASSVSASTGQSATCSLIDDCAEVVMNVCTGMRGVVYVHSTSLQFGQIEFEERISFLPQTRVGLVVLASMHIQVSSGVLTRNVTEACAMVGCSGANAQFPGSLTRVGSNKFCVCSSSPFPLPRDCEYLVTCTIVRS